MSQLTAFINRIANWKTLIGLFFLTILFPAVLFKNAENKINSLAGKDIGIVDLTFGFNPQHTLDMVAAYGEEGRAAYKKAIISLDFIFPIFYAFLFAVAITLVYRPMIHGPVRYLIMIPFMAMTFDFLENLAILALISYYPEQSVFMAILCEIFKLFKWLFFALSLFLVFFGLIRSMIRK
jgi:hypothetical protein